MEKQLLEFINRYYGELGVGDTPQNKSECVGLIEVWLDILGINDPHLWGNAKDLLANADPAKFDIVMNDPNDYHQFPPYGAIMVAGLQWGSGLGHCGVVLRANGYNFSLFQQNDPVGSYPHIKDYSNYAGWEGWLIPKL